MFCINNAAENEFIRSHIQYWDNYYWIGYTDMLPYGGGQGTKQYGWVTGCSSTYTNWAPGKPYNNNQDYVVVHPHNGQWQDLAPRSNTYCGCEFTPAL
jgi:hypothetical protein